MEKWEYMTRFVAANIETDDVERFLEQSWPHQSQLPKYSPQAMIPELNMWGEQGWEIIHMQPVWIGKNHDVHNYGYSRDYTNVYFCVMKRQKA